MATALRFCLIAWLFAASAARAQMPEGEYLDGGPSKVGVVLAHGQGLSPNSQVVGPLRRGIHRELGYHTMSLQMPTISGRLSPELLPQYGPLFPQAYERIQAAIDFLRKQKGVERVYLMGYSMGGRMMTGYLANTPDHGVAGFIGVGLVAGGPEPLNTNLNLRKIQIPVLDIYAENDVDARFAEVRRPFVSARFVQVPIPGARHDDRGFDQQILDATVAWLRGREGGT